MDVGLAGIGIGIIFIAVRLILSPSLTVQMQLLIALVGVLLMEASV
tara:strand:- start:349 stop:486 length:138 start_codon:yes stop_codon:yes gene_type:complete